MSYYRYCATYHVLLYSLIAIIISYGAERLLNNRTSAKKSLVPGRNEALALMRLVLRLTGRDGESRAARAMGGFRRPAPSAR